MPKYKHGDRILISATVLSSQDAGDQVEYEVLCDRWYSPQFVDGRDVVGLESDWGKRIPTQENTDRAERNLQALERTADKFSSLVTLNCTPWYERWRQWWITRHRRHTTPRTRATV